MKFKPALLALLTLFILSACGEDDTKGPYRCTSCADEPEALAANDNSGKGIYKGLVVGSSGTLRFNIANSDATLTAALVIDGEEFELATTSEYSTEGGFEGYFVNTMDTPNDEDDDISIGFYVNSTGTEFGVFNPIIPNHVDGITIELYKELSDMLVVAYEGTYTGDDEGIWNMTMIVDENGDGSWVAIGRPQDGNAEDDKYTSGKIEDGQIVGGDDGEIVVVGTVSGDIVKGSWSTLIDETSGTWKGKRTL
jgi:hypothetical protein